MSGDDGSVTGTVSEVAEQVGEGLGHAAEGVAEEGGTDGEGGGNEDVATGLETAGDVAGAVAQGAKLVEGAQELASGLAEGDGLDAAGGAGDLLGGVAGVTGALLDGVADLVPEAARTAVNEAASVVRTVAGVARSAGSVIEGAESFAQLVLGAHLEFTLHLDGEDSWKVRGWSLTEALNTPYEVVLDVETEDRDADPRALLGGEMELLLERGDEHHRRVTGIVRRVEESHQRSHHVSARLHVVPALWALGEGRDSVIFQQQTAVQILETVLARALGPYRREADLSGLGDDYAQREYCVQYRESHLAFCQRLMEEEGIGYYFDFEGDGGEKLVLFDRNGSLPPVATVADDAAIPFRSRAGIVSASNEPIMELSPARALTATHQMVRDYDWTQAQTRVEATVDAADDRGRTRSVYDHGHGRSVSLYDFQAGGRYQANDVDTQASRRHEGLLRDADRSVGVSLAIGMAPGHRFSLQDHPTPGMDGDYLVTKVTHHKSPPPGEEHHASGEAYHNVFECIPLAAEWRPERATPKPAIYGVQTAVVTGGEAGEIHTDEYGRIQVLFHWDREGVEPTSCWLRVAQVWAGHDGMGHPGFLFIPRVGMEAIVTFINGDPDRPMVTGTVYNGQNLPPVALPDEASRSMIRTRSLGGDGYNELSFEDAGGREEVHLRAERNLRELVRNDHTTHVLHDQTNTVDGKQEVHVEGEFRHVHVDHEERYDVDENRLLTIGGDHEVTVRGRQGIEVRGPQDVEVIGAERYAVRGAGGRSVLVEARLEENVGQGVTRRIDAGGLTTTTQGDSQHTVAGRGELSASETIRVTSRGGELIASAQGVSVTSHGPMSHRSVGPMTLQSSADITLTSPSKISAISPEGIKSISTGLSMEDLRIKFGFYMMSMSIYATKIDIVSTMKVDMCKFKLYNDGAKISLEKLSVGNTASARLARAAITVLG